MKKIFIGICIVIFCATLAARYLGYLPISSLESDWWQSEETYYSNPRDPRDSGHNHNPLADGRTYGHADGTHSHILPQDVIVMRGRICPPCWEVLAEGFAVMYRDPGHPLGWRVVYEQETEEDKYKVPTTCSDESEFSLRACQDRELAYPVVYCKQAILESP